MKAKILLIIMIILFAVSCAKNNPSNPVSNSSSNSGNTKQNDGGQNNNSNNSGNEENNNRNAENNKPEQNIDDKALEYRGIAEHSGESLDSVVKLKKENIEIYVDIYNDKKTVLVHTSHEVFVFEKVNILGTRYEAIKKDADAEYMLSMDADSDAIIDFKLTIIEKEYKFYIKAYQLDIVK